MSAEVVLEVALGDEALAADVAPVVAPAHVALHVHVQVALLGEAIAANLARKGLHAEVLPDVNIKS